MPRNGSGTYTLPSGNPVVSGTLIQSTWANPTMADIAAELTNSLARNGAGGMTGPLQLSNGSAATPALSFSSETTMGLYRVGAAQLGFSIAGTLRVTISSTDLTSTLPITAPGGTLTGNVSLAGNLTFVGFSRKITADTDNATINNRFAFQTSTLNQPTSFEVIPNGTSTLSQIALWNTTDRANATVGLVSVNGTAVVFTGTRTGSGTLPSVAITNGPGGLTFVANGNATMTAPSSGGTFTLNHIAGQAALFTTDGTTQGVWITNGANLDFGAFSNHPVRILSNNNVRISIAAAGNILINAPAAGGTVLKLLGGGSSEQIRMVGDGGFISWYNNAESTRQGYIQAAAGQLDIAGDNGAKVQLVVSTVVRLSIATTGKSTFTGGVLTATSSQAFTATPTFDANAANIFEFSGAMTANVTSCTLSNPTAGQTITIRVKQDGTGGRTFASPAGAIILGSVGLVAGKASLLTLTYSAMDTRWEGTWTQLP